MQNVWDYFLDLNDGRSNNGFGANSLSYTEIYSWVQLTGTTLSSTELKILKHLDRIYLSVHNKG